MTIIKKISLIALIALFCGNLFAQSNTVEYGVVINGVTWATRNVDKPGTFAEKPENAGMLYHYNNKESFYNNTDQMPANWLKNARSTSPVWEIINDPSPEGWRVPTKEELEKLFDKEKVTMKRDEKRKGMVFTDKASKDSIFFPFAGLRNGGYLSGAGRNGYYWSSQRHESLTDNAYRLSVSADPYDYADNVGNLPMFYAMSIRSVKIVKIGCNCDCPDLPYMAADRSKIAERCKDCAPCPECIECPPCDENGVRNFILKYKRVYCDCDDCPRPTPPTPQPKNCDCPKTPEYCPRTDANKTLIANRDKSCEPCPNCIPPATCIPCPDCVNGKRNLDPNQKNYCQPCKEDCPPIPTPKTPNTPPPPTTNDCNSGFQKGKEGTIIGTWVSTPMTLEIVMVVTFCENNTYKAVYIDKDGYFVPYLDGSLNDNEWNVWEIEKEEVKIMKEQGKEISVKVMTICAGKKANNGKWLSNDCFEYTGGNTFNWKIGKYTRATSPDQIPKGKEREKAVTPTANTKSFIIGTWQANQYGCSWGQRTENVTNRQPHTRIFNADGTAVYGDVGEQQYWELEKVEELNFVVSDGCDREEVKVKAEKIKLGTKLKNGSWKMSSNIYVFEYKGNVYIDGERFKRVK